MTNSERTNTLAESFGLTVETVPVPGHEPVVRVYRGAKLVFVGTNEAVQEFLANYQHPGNPRSTKPDDSYNE